MTDAARRITDLEDAVATAAATGSADFVLRFADEPETAFWAVGPAERPAVVAILGAHADIVAAPAGVRGRAALTAFLAARRNRRNAA